MPLRDHYGDLLPIKALGKSERYVLSLSRTRILTMLLLSTSKPVRSAATRCLLRLFCLSATDVCSPTIKIYIILRLTDTIYNMEVSLLCN